MQMSTILSVLSTQRLPDVMHLLRSAHVVRQITVNDGGRLSGDDRIERDNICQRSLCSWLLVMVGFTVR